jgi:hypothetical protein
MASGSLTGCKLRRDDPRTGSARPAQPEEARMAVAVIREFEPTADEYAQVNETKA